MSAPEYPTVFCIGNPLLDIQVNNAEQYLEKYGLKSNDAILAEEKHMPIYDEIVKGEVTYVAGGAAQNAARAAAYVLPPKHVVYVGAVGKDDLAEQLRAANDKEGVQSAYQVTEGAQTGACAVLLTGHDRSLVTTLRAAETFSQDHLQKPEIKVLLDHAKYFYIGGFFLTHGIDSAVEIAKHASHRGKVVTVNLSAPFIPQFFKVQLDQLLPYVDIVIGNESEAAAYATAQGMADSSIGQIASAIANLPKANASRPRLVLITQGANATLVASSSPSSPESAAIKANLTNSDPNPKTFPVPKLSDDQIVDTNGAGDMFAGGFLGALALGKTLDVCVETGHKLGQMCVSQVGPTLKYPKENVLCQ